MLIQLIYLHFTYILPTFTSIRAQSRDPDDTCSLGSYGRRYGVSLYAIPEISSTRDAFRYTVANAQKHGVEYVVPWLALGVGFQRTVRSGDGGWGMGTITLN